MEGKSIRDHIKDGIRYILHEGVSSLCFSFIFGLLGIELLLYLFEGKERAIVISVIGMGYILVIILYNYIFRKLIKRNDFSNTKKTNVRLFSTLGGILGNCS